MALHGYFTFPEINWPLYVDIPTIPPLPLWEHCQETGLFLMRQLVYLPQTNSKRHQKYRVPHNLHSTLQEYMYRMESPSPRSTKYKNSKKRSPQKSNASATSRPDSQRPAELWICTPFSARVEPWTAMNNDPTGTLSLGLITVLTFLGYFLKTCQSKLSSFSLAIRNTPQQGAHEPGTTANVPDSAQRKRFQQRNPRKECRIQCLPSSDKSMR